MRMRCGAKEGSTNGLPREQYKRLNKTRCFNLKAGDILGKQLFLSKRDIISAFEKKHVDYRPFSYLKFVPGAAILDLMVN